MQKRELLLVGIAIIVVFSSLSLAYTGDITNGIIPADTAYHELIHIANGTDGAGNILSIDANEDGTIDTAERSVEGVRGSGIPNALMKFKTNKNVTNSTIYELNGNVGFHIKNPTDTLQIMTGHIWNLGQNDAGIILRSGDEGSNGINIVTSSDGDLSIQTRYDKKNYDSLFIKGDSRNIGIGITNPLRALDIRSDDGIHLEPSKLPNSPLAGDIAIDNKDKKLKWYDGKEWLTVSDSKSLDADDGSPSDVVYVDSIGNVGIGTTSPSTQLDINGDTVISGDTQIVGQLSTQSDIDMGGNRIVNLADPQKAQDAATMNYVDTRIAASGSLPAGTSGQTLRHDGSDWVAASNLFNNGANVGIGASNPTQKLDVNGKIRMRSQTEDGDGDDIIATKGWVESKIDTGTNPFIEGFKWYSVGGVGMFLKDGASSYTSCVTEAERHHHASIRLVGGVFQTRAQSTYKWYSLCDSGWVEGEATCSGKDPYQSANVITTVKRTGSGVKSEGLWKSTTSSYSRSCESYHVWH